MAQFYFFFSFISTEIFLLTAMAYDRYVAICNPLRYVLIVNKRTCTLLASSSWILGFLDVVPHTVWTSQLTFCEDNVINHFFCDFEALIKLSCSDMHTIETLIFPVGVILGLVPFALTLASYIYIIFSILKIHSAKSRHKAFSTCSSHLTVVVLFYVSLICVYMNPTSAYSPDQNKLFSLLYTTLIPMLNPIVYSLRNVEVKTALTRIVNIKEASL
uniref:Olfactory receptor n=1 Tax=Geotrypetes seraphini TaxID=260995 RepID=A0A6P8R0J5_GEOSA|nr:olfactory receptor 1F1-like [Geotrypetes seraphini]